MDDFGFTFSSSEDEKPDTRLDQIFDLVLTFLDNLAKDPTKDTIKWPNRAADIERFKQKLSDIKDGTD